MASLGSSPSFSNSDLDAYLRRSPYRVVCDSSVPSDPLNFFRGGEPSLADVQEGWTIDRVLIRGAESIDSETFSSTLLTATPGKVFRLRAETGEGKTTFLRQLTVMLKSRGVTVLEWVDFRRHSPETVRTLIDVERRQVIVIADATSDAQEYLPGMAMSLYKDPLPCPLLIAASSLLMTHSRIRNSDEISFAHGVSDIHFAQLLRNFQRFISLAQTNGWNIGQEVPNIREFVSQPDPTVFAADRPLFISLLEATYGWNFHTRLTDEYNAISSRLQKDLYRYICCFHAVGLDTPTEVLHHVFKGHEVDSALEALRCARIVVDGKAQHSVRTRNRIIAAVVAEQAGLIAFRPFSEFVQSLLVFGAANLLHIALIRRLVFFYCHWSPVGPDHRDLRNGILSALRRVLANHEDWLRNARNAVFEKRDWGLALSWSAAVYHALPQRLERSAGQATRTLLKIEREWLQVCAATTPEPANALVGYLQAKGRLLQSMIDGEDSSVRREVLREWAALLPSHHTLDQEAELGLDFYIDLATLADDESRCEGPENLHWMIVAADAYEEALNRLGHSRNWIGRQYSDFLRWVYGKLNVADLTRVLKGAWDTSVLLHPPNPGTGTAYAQELLKAGDEDAAIAVLKRILAYHCWGEAILQLARLAERNDDLETYIIQYSRMYESSDIGHAPINTALASHAFAIVCGRRGMQDKQTEWLKLACDNYHNAATSDVKKVWRHFERDWREAAQVLITLLPAEREARNSQIASAAESFAGVSGRPIH